MGKSNMTDTDNSRLYIDDELTSRTGFDRRSILKMGIEGKIRLWYHFFDVIFSATSPEKKEKRRLHSIELRISTRECSRLLEAVDLESFSVPDVYGYAIDQGEGLVSNAKAKFPWMANSPQQDLTITLKNLFTLKSDIDALETAKVTTTFSPEHCTTEGEAVQVASSSGLNVPAAEQGVGLKSLPGAIDKSKYSLHGKKKAADHLKVSERSITNYIRDGMPHLPLNETGNVYWFNPESIKEWFEKRKEDTRKTLNKNLKK